MSDQLAGLVISLIAGGLLFTIAMLIRIRGPIGLVKNVDWERVSDPQALGHFASMIMSLIGALIAAHGVLRYALRADPPARNVGSVVFVILIASLVLALLLGLQRFQDKARRDGRR